MLKRYSQLFVTMLVIADLGVITSAWVLAYWIRFELLEAPLGVPEFQPYAQLLALILPIFLLSFRSRGLYLPHRISRRSRELANTLVGSSLAYTLLIVLNFFLRDYLFSYSRGVLLIFFPLQIAGMVFFRTAIRAVLRELRRRGYNLRHVVILGAGELGAEVVKRIRRHPEMGLNIHAVLGKDESKLGMMVEGIEVVGVYEEVRDLLAKGGVDQVIIALPIDAHARTQTLLELIGPTMVDIRIVPDLYRFISLRRGIEDFDGLPVINLLSTPLYGWNRVLKRSFDLFASLACMVVGAPVIMAFAIGVKLSSRGPVFYRQERMGLDGHTFRMYKFRTMRQDAESETGPVWASQDDPRRTRYGAWLREHSCDELPQLLNVLKGDMSLVGPRPERPVFIEQFQDRIPEYMLRHRMQAGVTGWAQVNGWRGNTSLERRIECDLYYIENWSLTFDLRILGLTLVRGFRSQNAY